jgi:hypothetical protein
LSSTTSPEKDQLVVNLSPVKHAPLSHPGSERKISRFAAPPAPFRCPVAQYQRKKCQPEHFSFGRTTDVRLLRSFSPRLKRLISDDEGFYGIFPSNGRQSPIAETIIDFDTQTLTPEHKQAPFFRFESSTPAKATLLR